MLDVGYRMLDVGFWIQRVHQSSGWTFKERAEGISEFRMNPRPAAAVSRWTQRLQLSFPWDFPGQSR